MQIPSAQHAKAAAAQEAAADETAGDEADAVDEAAVEADEEGLEETANGEANENHEDGEEEDVEMETQAEADWKDLFICDNWQLTLEPIGLLRAVETLILLWLIYFRRRPSYL